MSSRNTIAEIRRQLSAPPRQVFDAFAQAKLVSLWLSPSPEIALTILDFDFRVGGNYRFAYHLPGGGTMTVNGVYKFIEAPSSIIFSWVIEPPDEHAGLQSEVSVRIAATGDGTELFIRHEYLRLPGSSQRHTEGWLGAVDRLAQLLSDQKTEGGLE